MKDIIRKIFSLEFWLDVLGAIMTLFVVLYELIKSKIENYGKK